MSKLISNPTECGYRHKLKPLESPHLLSRILCNALPGIIRPCLSKTNFPANCPLQDGQPIPKTIEELTQLVKKDLMKYTLLPPRATDKGKEITKKRNRKNCVNYSSKGKCCIMLNRSYTCIGVNCGDFKTKKE